MTDNQFDVLLEKTIKNFGMNYIDLNNELNEPHEFSHSFERKMRKLIKKQSSFYFPLVKTPLRRLVTIAVTVIITMSVLVMSVSAFRDALINFITEMFDTHTTVQTIPDDNAPLTFENIYEITEIPEGFELTYCSEIKETSSFIEFDYQNNENYIFFTQYLKKYYDADVNTEGYEMNPITINGCEGFIIDYGTVWLITWDNGDYIIEVQSNIGKDELIETAKSVQKRE